MSTLGWFLLLGAIVVLVGAPSNERPRPRRAPSWFDILPALEAEARRARPRRRRK